MLRLMEKDHPTRPILKVDVTVLQMSIWSAEKGTSLILNFCGGGFMRLGGNSEIIAVCQNNGMLKRCTYFAIWVQASAI